MRIIKKAEERKKEIGDIAYQLFHEHGYDSTSVNQIIQKTGISKGAFYHHFKSKEQLLNYVVDQFTDKLIMNLLPILDENTSALEKMNELFQASSNYKSDNIDTVLLILKSFYNDKNLLLRTKFYERSIKKTLPIYTGILQQGVDENIFDVENFKETSRLILMLGVSTGEYNSNLLLKHYQRESIVDEMYENYNVYFDAIERVLGLPKNSITRIDFEILHQLKMALIENEN